eukprot:2532216-Rhodomonas_salina.2
MVAYGAVRSSRMAGRSTRMRASTRMVCDTERRVVAYVLQEYALFLDVCANNEREAEKYRTQVQIYPAAPRNRAQTAEIPARYPEIERKLPKSQQNSTRNGF